MANAEAEEGEARTGKGGEGFCESGRSEGNTVTIYSRKRASMSDLTRARELMDEGSGTSHLEKTHRRRDEWDRGRKIGTGVIEGQQP